MNKEEILHLLDKYYSAETSIAEETFLKEFFSSEDVPAELSAEKEIFRFYIQNSSIPPPSEHLAERIISAVDNATAEKPLVSRLRIFRLLSGVAAGLILLAGSYLLFTHKSTLSDTYADPEIAYNETMKILNDVSVRMSRGTGKLAKIYHMQNAANESLKIFERPAGIVREKMKPLSLLHDAYKLIENQDTISLNTKLRIP